MQLSPSLELMERYGGPGPRYTSYPAANLWGEVDGALIDKAALHADRTGGPLSLYVHVPFCTEMCRFCGCNVIATRNRSRADGYLDVLEKELALWAEKLPSRRSVSQLHLGGGTPTFLDEKQLTRLHEMISSHFTFVPGAEKALEIDPVVTTESQLSLLGSLGFTRLSIGVQDLDPHVQAAIARPQSAEITEKAIRSARSAGFQSVNFDLIYGLPYQTPVTIRSTLTRLLEMGPDRFSLFGYAHVPWMKPNQRLLPVAHLPPMLERVALFNTAAQVLEQAGYRQIGLDHFAREGDPLSRAQTKGTLTRNFQGYAERSAGDTLAIGPSAISDLGGAYLQNTHRYNDWESAIVEGRLGIEKGHARSVEDEMRGEAIRTLMCLLRIDIDRLEERFGEKASELWRETELSMAPLAEDGLVVMNRRGLRVTALGRLFLRAIARQFDATLPPESMRPAYSSGV